MAGKGICKIKTVYQMEATECGAASLCMIMSFWGHYVPLELMRVETGVSRDGCAAGNIMRAAMRFGLETHGYKKKAEALKKIQMPCIIHWNSNHFVVLEGMSGKYAYINDPAMGRYKVSINDFERSYSGIVITFKPTDGFVRSENKNVTVSSVKRRLSDNKKDIIFLFFIGIIMSVPVCFLPYFSRVFIDSYFGNSVSSSLTVIIAAVSVIFVVQGLFSYYRNLSLTRIQSRVILESSRDFLKHLFRLPISFFEQRYTGDLVTRVSNNDSVNLFLTGTLAVMFIDFVSAFVFAVFMFVYSIELGIIGIAGFGIEVLVIYLASRKTSELTAVYKQDEGKLTGIITSGVAISSTIKASGAESIYASRIIEQCQKVSHNEKGLNRFLSWVNVIPDIIDNLILIMIIVLGAYRIADNSMTVGMLVAFAMTYKLFSTPGKKIITSLHNIQELVVDIARVDDIMAHPESETYDVNDTIMQAREKLSGEVRCEGISFGYSKMSAPVVSDISFEIGCGESIALVGASGSGNSTVAKLISGLYRPDEGSIYIDNKEISNIDLDIFHASVSTVSQNVALFAGTVKDNLTMWNPAILEEDMIKAAKDACIHDDIMRKSGGYEFRLTESASNISGGQRQRLEIARALVTNPTILVLDEATSALDPVVEKQILENIKRRGCTAIVVAHRLSAVRDCDYIAVFKDGRIVQMGRNEDLMGEEGIYKELMALD